MIQIDSLSLKQGTFGLADVSFRIQTRKYGVLMGATGSGKTTLLEAICGLRRISQGKIRLDGRDVTTFSPSGREIGYVPQDLALFPHLTVADHLSFGPRVKGWSHQQLGERIRELAYQLGIESLLQRFPGNLSGGEAQRVCLGRALAAKPSVLLLDEPLSALDESTREEMTALLRALPGQHQVTILHVTHNLAEAGKLADQLLILEKGRVNESDFWQRSQGLNADNGLV